MNKLLAKLLKRYIRRIESREETTFDKDKINQNNSNGATVNQQALYNKKYKPQDDDWACDEDCIPLADTFKWTDSINKKQLIQSMGLILQDYLLQGEYVNKLKTPEAVGFSFDDGNMNFLYLNQ